MNHWLETRRVKDNPSYWAEKRLTLAIRKYKDDPSSENRWSLGTEFVELAGKVYRMRNCPEIGVRKFMAIMNRLAFEKLNTYDIEKGHALNYFTACMLGHYDDLRSSAASFAQRREQFLQQFEAKKDWIKTLEREEAERVQQVRTRQRILQLRREAILKRMRGK